MRFYFDRNIESVAHRGYSGKFKDNSYTAIKKAYQRFFDMIEIDIQVCKTGELVIYNSPILKSQCIKNLSFKEIIKKDRSIITFKQFTENFPYLRKKLYLNLKGDIKTAYHLFIFIKIRNIDYSNIIAFSRNADHINYLKLKLPDLKRGYITSNIPCDYMLKYIHENVSIVSLSYKNINNEIIDKLHNINKKVFVYTIKNHHIANYVRKFNIDGVISNFKITRYISNNF
jgi:glycerophosphoryl diester phosphodiesterase